MDENQKGEAARAANGRGRKYIDGMEGEKKIGKKEWLGVSKRNRGKAEMV